MTISSDYSCDVLIIGSGAAGLSLALRLGEKYKVIVLSKSLIKESSTLYAQGGIAAVFNKHDSIESHIEDTNIAGCGLCDHKIVSFIVHNSRHCIKWLIDKGMLFDKDLTINNKESYHLAHEGGHSHRRVLHSADKTGKALENTLIIQALSHSNILLIEQINAIDLIVSDKIGLTGTNRVVGAYIWDRKQQRVKTCRARVVVLATGGAAKVYQYTTNPDIASGDGIAMAWRAGCRVANLEFNQFHPTCLMYPSAKQFLLTEALRGEGAFLKRPDGSRFMPDLHSRAELAPRDVVARAIDHEIKRLGTSCMYLDISHKPAEFICEHFPTIYKKLLTIGFDITKEPIPIIPAAHYTCGGVIVDHTGKTDLSRLYAIGEVSYTGLHGANRLASNSLLECLVYSWSSGKDIECCLPYIDMVSVLPPWNNKNRVKDLNEQLAIIESQLNKLRLLMWDHVGIVRTTKSLNIALQQILAIKQEISEYYIYFRISDELLELRNLLEVAELIVRCAIARKESRGLHYNLDYPDNNYKESLPTILLPN